MILATCARIVLAEYTIGSVVELNLEFNIWSIYVIVLFNKTFLLHERKRHTARHIASTRYAVLVRVPPVLGSDLDGGVPPPIL